jgi:hypothetical protein
MKTTVYSAIALLVTVTMLAACTRENGLIRYDGPSTSKDSTSTDSTYTGPISNNYQPDTSGSTWTYQVKQVFNIAQSTIGQLYPQAATSLSAFSIDTTIVYHVAALTTTTRVGSLTYTDYSNDYGGGIFNPKIAQSGTSYIGVDEVWELVWPAGGFGGFSLNDDTLTYLKDQPVGTSWIDTTIVQDAYGSMDTTVYAFSVKATGSTRAVSGVNYPNVIQIESATLPSALTSYAVLLSGQGVNLNTTTEYYYARNVGLIEEDLSAPFFGITVNAILLHSNIR